MSDSAAMVVILYPFQTANGGYLDLVQTISDQTLRLVWLPKRPSCAPVWAPR